MKQASSISSRPGPRRESAYTLVEMLVVIAIISILLTIAAPFVDRLSTSNSPSVIAAQIEGQLGRARAHAVARNTHVWVRIGPMRDDPNGLHLSVIESIDGTQSVRSNNLSGAWTSPRFPNLTITAGMPEVPARPQVSESDRASAALWLHFHPAGEVRWFPAASSADPGELQPPADGGKLARLTEIGLQPTRRGTVTESLKKDVAVIQISGLTGQTFRFAP